MGVGWWLGWPLGADLVRHRAVGREHRGGVARFLQERRLLDTERGRITVGWLIVQDIAMVLVLVFLPALAALFQGMETAPACRDLALDHHHSRQVRVFVAGMLIVGKKLIPVTPALCGSYRHPRAVPPRRARDRASASPMPRRSCSASRFALGAFFAGMILSESALSQQAATESLPLRDAFAVLFFVSVGMLFNPA